MKFESVKCDCCGKIQDISNHWMKVSLWVSSTGGNVVALGAFANELNCPIERQELDLCGQSCALKLLAKLLGWSTPGAAE